MKIVCLFGSPLPKGNSATIANVFLEEASKTGATIQKVRLSSLRYSGCQACMQCKLQEGGCQLQDELKEVLDSVLDSDLLVMAAPVHHGDLNATMRAFIERSHSFLGPPQGPLPGKFLLSRGKQVILIIAQGYDEDMHEDLYPRYNALYQACGFEACHLIRACGVVGPGEVLEKQPEVLDLARKLAGELCNGDYPSTVKSRIADIGPKESL